MTSGATAILGFDPFADAFRADPHPQFRRLAEGGRLWRTEAGLWVTTSYELCSAVLRDPRFGHRSPGGGSWRDTGSSPPTRSFLTLDPPDHTRLRRLVSKAFGARLIAALEPRIAAVTEQLLDGLAGPVDLVSALAYPLPVIVISELLGVPPEDQDQFKTWSDALARGLDPDFILPPQEQAARETARAEFAAYFTGLLDERRRAPREDLLSALVAVRDGGDVLSTEELLATCVLLLVAGHETTVNLIAGGAHALLTHPGQLAWFRAHPEAVERSVEELLRHQSPVQLTLRTAQQDLELAGERLPAGTSVLLLLSAANRDPEIFPDPDRLDLTRRSDRHLAFGLGIHFCLGAPLARLEGQIALSRLFRRDVVLAAPPTYRDNLVLRGPATLPVRLR